MDSYLTGQPMLDAAIGLGILAIAMVSAFLAGRRGRRADQLQSKIEVLPEMVRDEGERERIEETLRRVYEASRLKSEFLANMSHELRTPLNTVMGFASFIQAGKAGPVTDAQKDYLGDILQSSRHLLQLIDDILDLAKIEAGKMKFAPEPLDLAQVVREVGDSMQVLAAEKSLALSIEVEPALAPAMLDRAKLKQVLYNFLSNSIKFTPDHGSVALRVTPDRGQTFRLEVEDTGIGIAADELPHLFADFHQLDVGNAKKYPGTGLGLSLTKRIVEAQGGMVGVRSSPGVGSTFWAILPLDASDAAQSVHPPMVDIGPPAPEVLVVEADPHQRGWLVQALREADYDVQAVATGDAAISLCEQRAFSAIMLDLLLPEVSGLEIVRRIRATTLNLRVPVMAVTVSSEGRASATFVLHDFMVTPSDELILASLRRAAVGANSGPILIVDEDSQSLARKEATLTRLGYLAIARSSRADALATAEKTPPAAIIIDLLTPAMSGFEFLDELRRTPSTRSVSVIAWTDRELPEDDRQQLRIAAQHSSLRSPTSTEAMLEELRPHLAHAQRARDAHAQAA